MLGPRVEFAAARAREPGVHSPDSAIAADDERRREGVEIHGLGHFRVEVVGIAGEQHGVLEPVSSDERAQTCWIGELIAVLERQGYDLQAPRLVLLVDRSQERRLVVAVGAPAAADVDEDDLAANCASVFETTRPLRSGKLKRNGSDVSATVVWREGSVGDPSAVARASLSRTAVSSVFPFCRRRRLPSDCGVTSSRSGRAPEK